MRRRLLQEEYRLRAVGDDDVVTRLVVTSGKMVLLDKLLTRLKQTGHRCAAGAAAALLSAGPSPPGAARAAGSAPGVRLPLWLAVWRQGDPGLQGWLDLLAPLPHRRVRPSRPLRHAGCSCSARWFGCWTSSAVSAACA